MRAGDRKSFTICLTVLSISVGAARPAFKPETSWKHYRNRQWHYCVSYPSRWSKGEAYEGAGMFVETGIRKHSRPVGEIDISALPKDRNGGTEMTPVSLTENFELHVEGLKRFQRAEHLEILERRAMTVSGNSALFTKDRYFDPQDGATWADEILFVERNETLYRLELECRSDQLARFEPVFSHLADTFQIDCRE